MSEIKEVIRVLDIRKTYEMGKTKVHALQGVDFSVREGEMVAIMGASGSGKSTLMNIIGGLDYPTSGSYFLDDIEINKLSKNQLADIRNQKIGFVFQGFNLLARTSALENTELPLLYDRSKRVKKHSEAARHSLERVGLGDRVDHFPNELSGGQQQRVAIARALVTNPSLVLADEPTGNLDSKTTVEVMSLFQELNAEGVTILLVTHEDEVARYAKRIVELRDGKIIRDIQQTPDIAAQDLKELLATRANDQGIEELEAAEAD
jgi:putative ABC transport system ATP-binding protein